MSALDRARVALSVLRHGVPEPTSTWARAMAPAFVPADNPTKTDEGMEATREAALRMLDDDCYGYLLLTIHKEAVGPGGEIRLADHLDSSWWPAVAVTLERVIAAVRSEA